MFRRAFEDSAHTHDDDAHEKQKDERQTWTTAKGLKAKVDGRDSVQSIQSMMHDDSSMVSALEKAGALKRDHPAHETKETMKAKRARLQLEEQRLEMDEQRLEQKKQQQQIRQLREIVVRQGKPRATATTSSTEENTSELEGRFEVLLEE